MSTVILGVTGGIAAYKSAALASLLKKHGVDVHVVMTKHACEFVSPLTFETLTANAVTTDTFSRSTPHDVWHISLAKRADVTIIAPATANILAKAAGGLADDFLSTYLLATRSALLFAPAMNTAMYEHEATVRNLDILRGRGAHIIEGESGMLACGDAGRGRMAEPELIFERTIQLLQAKSDFAGKSILVTAGPTAEDIDGVRFLTNRSTGKMGYEVAQAAVQRGASVTLISGPVNLKVPSGLSEFVPVRSAQQMYKAATERFEHTDIVVKTAAVADYTPEEYIAGKLQKSGDMNLKLVRTKDILAELGQRKTRQLLIGFAAQTQDIEAYARKKLVGKNLDMICANDVSRTDGGFASDNNDIIMIKKDGERVRTGSKSKREVAHSILDEILKLQNM